MNPLVSIIVLNYQGLQFLEENLKSIQKQTYSPIETIFVDNASQDNSVEWVRSNFPEVQVLENSQNIGFAGNNLGIEKSSGKYLLILNNDTVLEPDMLAQCVEEIEKDPTIGMCSPKVLSKDQPGLLDAFGINIYPDGTSRQRGRLEEDLGQYDRVEEVLLPAGCAAFYRRDMLNEIGLFDKDFFAYCEDTDLGFRGRLAGWRSISVPKARLYHSFSGFWRNHLEKKAFLVERNHLWFALKCFPVSLLLTLPFYTLLRFFFQVQAVIQKKGFAGEFIQKTPTLKLLIILFKAYYSTLVHLPELWKKRREIQKTKKVSSKEIRRWFKQYRLSLKDIVFKN